MKLLKTAALVAALGFSAVAAQAQTTYDFSYTFTALESSTPTPITVTGSFTGTQVGGLISNIGNVSVAVNGVAFAGPLSAEALDNTGTPTTAVAAVVSSNVAQSNFVFADFANGTIQSNLFTVAPQPDQNGVVEPEAFAQDGNIADAATGNILAADERAASNAHWTVTAVSAVPEPGTYALMAFGLGLVALRLNRRRQA